MASYAHTLLTQAKVFVGAWLKLAKKPGSYLDDRGAKALLIEIQKELSAPQSAEGRRAQWVADLEDLNRRIGDLRVKHGADPNETLDQWIARLAGGTQSAVARRDDVIEECIEACYLEAERLRSYSENPNDASEKEARGATGCTHRLRALKDKSVAHSAIGALSMPRDLVIAIRTYVQLKRDRQDAMGLDHGATDLLLSRIDAAMNATDSGADRG
jgi:hypothetical protein